MTDFLAAAVQLTSTSQPEINFSAAEEQIELASRRGAELVGLPENFAFIGDDKHRLEISSSLAEQCSKFWLGIFPTFEDPQGAGRMQAQRYPVERIPELTLALFTDG